MLVLYSWILLEFEIIEVGNTVHNLIFFTNNLDTQNQLH